MDFIFFLLIGMAAGWLAGQFLKGHSFGLLGNLIVGIVGAILGGFVFRLLGFGIESLLAELVTATLGAILFLYLLRFVK